MTETASPVDVESAASDIRTEPNRRLIRGFVGGKPIVASADSLLVWEIPYYPQWYFPRTDVLAELRPTGQYKDTDGLGTAVVYDLVITADETETVIAEGAWVYPESPATAVEDRVRIRWDAVDRWLEEDVEVIIHPRSPYTRVDALPSSRVVRVSVDGTVVAETDRSTILYETGLRPRYYLPAASVAPGLLSPSDTTTACPYKGVARYWDVTVDGTTHPDLVWGYDNPLPESAGIQGLICFYNERVEITVDGQPAPTS